MRPLLLPSVERGSPVKKDIRDPVVRRRKEGMEDGFGIFLNIDVDIFMCTKHNPLSHLKSLQHS